MFAMKQKRLELRAFETPRMESSHEDEDDSNGDNEDESNESAPPRAPKRARPIRAAASETGTGSLARTSQSHSEPPSRAPGPSGGGSRRSGLRGEQEEEQEGGDLVQFRRDLGCEDGLLEFSVSLKQMTDAEIMDLVWRAKEGLAEATMADVLADVFDVLNRRDVVNPDDLMAACWAKIDAGDARMYEKVDVRYVRSLSRITFLSGQVDERVLEEGKTVMNQCIWRLFSTAEVVSLAIKARLPPEDLELLPSLISRVLSLPKQLNDFQRLLLVLMSQWSSQGLRKGREDTDENVYRRVFTPEGHDTHYWTKVTTVEKWVNKECKLRRTAAWGMASRDPSARKRVAEWILKSDEEDFASIPRDRHVFAFNNGIYDAASDTFHKYPATQLPSDVGACRYFEIDIDESLFQEGVYTGDFDSGDWFDIDTPDVNRILNDQDFPENVQRPYWALAVGRMLYSLKERDRFEVMVFFKGVGGSGKSTLVKIIEFIYGLEAGILSNNVESLFGLSQHKDRYVIISYELNEKFSLAQAEFTSLVSGESMSLAEKHKYASRLQWTAPFLAAGNRLFWQMDNANQVSRRLIMFNFDNKPAESDNEMEIKIKANIGEIIVKGNRAYHALCRKVNNASLINNLPDWFNECRRRAQESSNPLYTFLTSVSWVEVEEHNYCPWEEFQKRFNDWNRQRDPRSRVVFEEDFYKHVFTEFKLRLVFQKVWKVYPLDQDDTERPAKKKAFWLYGVDFANENAAPPMD